MNIIYDIKENIPKHVVGLLEEQIKEIKKEKITLAVPGGRSVAAIFDVLKEAKLPWEKMHIFIIDERCVQPSSEDYNFNIAKKHFVDYLLMQGKITDEQIHPYRYLEQVEDWGLKKYEEELLTVANGYDIILLSAGEDGHVAALFPEKTILDKGEFFVKTNDSPKPPPKRMSASRTLLEKASLAFLLFIGEGKKEALTNFRDPEITVEKCPAKLVAKIPNTFIFTDIK